MVNIHKLYLFVVLFSCIRPAGIHDLFPFLDLIIYKFLAILCGSFVILFTLVKLIKLQVSKLSMILFGYLILLLFITYIKAGNVGLFVQSWFYPIVVLCLFENNKGNANFLFRSMFFILEFLVFINLIFMLLYPEGAYSTNMYQENWFLGYKSSFQYVFFPLLFLALVYNYYNNEWLNLGFVQMMIHVETILAWNAMFLVVLFIFDIILLCRLLRFEHLLNVRNYVISVILINVLFVFFLFQLLTNPTLSYLFKDILGKSDSLTSRVTMWAMAIKNIISNPIVGLGYIGSDEIAKLSGIRQGHVHNQFLQLVLTSGIVGISIFMLYVWEVLRKISKQYDLYLSRLVALFIWGIFLATIVEIFISPQAMCIWPLFFIGYYAKNLDRQFANNNKTTSINASNLIVK